MRPDRRAMSLVEIMIVCLIVMVILGTALSTMRQNRRASDLGERVDEYRRARILTNRLLRDLQEATMVETPAYGTATDLLALRDDRYRRVLYQTGVLAGSGAGLGIERRLDEEAEVIQGVGALESIRFSRIGERLLRVSFALAAPPGPQGAARDARMPAVSLVVALPRVLR